MGRRVTVLVHKGYNLVQLSMVVRATQKLQEQCLAAKLSYQAWRGVEDDTARLRKEEQNQGLLALNVGINVECQGSRARSAGKAQDRAMNLGQCRITGIMLNAINLVFRIFGPLPTPKTARRCCVCNIPVQECLTS